MSLKRLILTFNAWEKRDVAYNQLVAKRSTIAETIFPDRVLPTSGLFCTKPAEFTGRQPHDPCVVTEYACAHENLWDDDIINLGSDNDVKDFPCEPYYQEGVPCTNTNCQFCSKNHKFWELTKQIEEAKKERAIAARHLKEARKNLFKRSR